MMDDLKGRRIVVTGAASGIGAATARVLDEAGAEPILVDRSPLDDHRHKTLQIDLTDSASLAAGAAALPDEIDGLCNIAGLALPHPPEAIVAANIVGTRLFTEQVLTRMEAGATIVNVASTASRLWRVNAAASARLLDIPSLEAVPAACRDFPIGHDQSYPMTKEALVIWTLILSQRLIPRGIRVNAVSPGATQTPMMAPAIAASGARGTMTLDNSPRIANAEELARVIAFLCSGASSAMNGANVAVDNGLTAALDSKDYVDPYLAQPAA